MDDRFFAKVVVGGGDCWLWIGGLNEKGYGRFHLGGRYVKAHRYAYELLTGQTIPNGMHIDHLCRVRRCVNPDHLRVVTPRENRVAPGARTHAAKTHCGRGHPFSDENTYLRANGYRTCKTCHTALARIRYAQRKGYVPPDVDPATLVGQYGLGVKKAAS